MDNPPAESKNNGEIRWIGLLRETLEQCGDTRAVGELERAYKLYQDGRIYVTVAGKPKCGRSSLINALLGRRDDTLAPTSKLYSTNVVCGFARGDASSATVILRDGTRAYCGVERVREFVTDESNPRNTKGIAYVEVYGGFEGIDPDLVLVDTPAVAVSDAETARGALDFVPHTDAILVVAAAKMPLNKDDAILVKRIIESKIPKVFMTINKADQATLAELDEATTHNRSALQYAGVKVDAIRRVSACRALWGEQDDGLIALQKDIDEFVKARKKAIVGARLVSQALAITERCAHALNAKTIGEADPQVAKLTQFSTALRGLLAEMKT